jgi:hypothetical protein
MACVMVSMNWSAKAMKEVLESDIEDGKASTDILPPPNPITIEDVTLSMVTSMINGWRLCRI